MKGTLSQNEALMGPRILRVKKWGEKSKIKILKYKYLQHDLARDVALSVEPNNVMDELTCTTWNKATFLKS